MPWQLARAIRQRLEADLASLYLPLPESDKLGRPQVCLGGLPFKTPDKRDLPCVVVQPLSGQDDDEDQPRLAVRETVVRLLCTIVGNEADERPVEAGHHVMLNLVSWCLASLRRPGNLENRYILAPPLTWEFRDAEDEEGRRPHPYYLGVIESRWREVYSRTNLTRAEEEEIHGSGQPG